MLAEYDARAATYDATRSASPSTLSALLRALGPPEGRRLLDIGGGTGNYAAPLQEAGFRVTLADVSGAMLRRAIQKLGAGSVLFGDALHLPFRAGPFGCAVSVNISHHIADWRQHIAEAKRVVGEGVFALQINTLENLEAHWILEYFPEARELTLSFHPTAQEVGSVMRAVGFRDVRWDGYVFEDRADATFEALKHWPETYLDPVYRRNTTFFRRLSAEVERTGVKLLRTEHASGALSEVIARYEPRLTTVGDSTVFVGSS